MRRMLLGITAAAIAATFTIAWLALPGSAAKGTSAATSVGVTNTKTTRVITLRAAQHLANVALKTCAQKGFAVTVTVVDRDGIDLVTLRSEDATGATVPVALGKAYASAGFRSPTGGLQDAAKTQPGFISLPGFVILPGGEPIVLGKQLLGGVGVSGAPSGDIDDACAKAGLAAIG
jgi:uncharacterized protein GlcG (DUF336 family)